MGREIAVIIGAGPAGLTAAYELTEKTNIKPVVYEATSDIGGISKTINYKGNRIDIGGHRFFSKSDRIMHWWENILPLQGQPSKDDIILGRNIPLSEKNYAPNPEKTDHVMLVRSRLSRIFFMRKFFDYPVSLNFNTLSNLGMARIVKIGLSYIIARFSPIKDEDSLEDFFINRFGRELYLTFFKDYTAKVWGVPPDRIKPEWGSQRIKELSIAKAILHAIKNVISKDLSIAQKNTETSLITQFLYPKLGPGQLWEKTAQKIKDKGGSILLKHRVTSLIREKNRIVEVEEVDENTGRRNYHNADYFFSSMPIKDLIAGFRDNVPDIVYEVAHGLMYRDFMTIGLLLKKLKIENKTKIPTINNIIPDNWIYVQDRDVRIGRLQIFNNWSPYMVKDNKLIWIGLEYFCREGESLWAERDDRLIDFAVSELSKINIIERSDVLDSVVIRVPKAYPAYFGSYDNFDVIREYLDSIENLFLIGRNGMHKYNNQDHSMLTAMTAVENIVKGISGKDNIWAVNSEDEYHEKS